MKCRHFYLIDTDMCSSITYVSSLYFLFDYKNTLNFCFDLLMNTYQCTI